MICSNCGKRFNKSTERSIFNHYNDSSGWDFGEDTTGDLCSECAQDYCETQWMLGEKEADDGPSAKEDVDKYVEVIKGIWDLFK